MKVYTMREFRNNAKKALDESVLGEEVYIDRLGQMHQIVYAGPKKRSYVDVKNSVPVLPGQMTIDEGIEQIDHVGLMPKLNTVMAAKGAEFCKHNAVKGFCKKGCK